MATRLPVAPVPGGDINDCLERIRARAGALEESISDIISGLRDGTIVLPQSSPHSTIVSCGPPRDPVAPIKETTKPRKWSDPMYERLAQPGVMDLEIARHDKGYSLVSINRAPACRIPNRQADFLRTIARLGAGSAGTSGDEFVPWTCKAALAHERGCTEHALDVMVGRLRERLWFDFKVSPLLVENDAGHVRFRLRARKPDAP